MKLNDWKAYELAYSEEHFQETLEKSREAFYRAERSRLLCYWEFLFYQLRYTRKRWWLLQFGLLLLGAQIVPAMEADSLQMRSLGVIGCLFTVFMIPELWRNRDSESTQVEAACLYSLRQIYSARILLFGIVDVCLLTGFCFRLGGQDYSAMELVSQFLLPATVTACICFALLCGKQIHSETACLSMCLTFSGGWWLMLLNDSIYYRVLPGVWLAMFLAALAFLLALIRKTLVNTNLYWELENYGITAC